VAAFQSPKARVRRATALCVLNFGLWTLGLLFLATPAFAQRPGSFREEARVERVIVDAYVTDAHGDPIPDLTAEEFRLRVDGKAATIESVEWIPADQPEAAPLSEEAVSGGETAPAVQIAPGRLLIFFFQTDLFVTSRLTGLMQMALQARRLLGTLLPTDRVAVLSFDSHLKLRQDFTSDRRKLLVAIDKAILTGPPPEPDSDAWPSLARHFDFRAAKRSVTPEKALALISRAAASIVGPKSMIFFGWGLQTIGGMTGPNPRDTKDLRDALPALAAARIAIFTLDVTNADYHSLEGTLENISAITGGSYQKTHIFPTLAIDRVRRAIAGRYVLVFKKPERPRGTHAIDVSLVARKGRVLARATYAD
jgi:VWFA-related protein